MATGDHYVLRYAGALNRSRAQRVIYTAQALLRLDVLLLVCYRPLARTTHVITRGGSGTPARHAGSILGLVNILFCFEVILRPHHGEEIAATNDKKGPEFGPEHKTPCLKTFHEKTKKSLSRGVSVEKLRQAYLEAYHDDGAARVFSAMDKK